MNTVPQYPVIAISPGDSFLVIDEPIVQCSARGWRNGYFDDLVFFDSAGLLWPTHASLRNPLSFFDRFRRAIPVDLDFGKPEMEAQAKAVAMLETLIDEDDSDLYDQFVSRSELKDLFRRAPKPADLIAVARTLGAGRGPNSEAETS